MPRTFRCYSKSSMKTELESRSREHPQGLMTRRNPCSPQHGKPSHLAFAGRLAVEAGRVAGAISGGNR